MSVTLIVRPEAQEQAERADAWWKANRSAAPLLFEEEWAHSLDLIERHPDIGHLVKHRHVSELRVVALQRTRYLVYYVHDARASEVVVLAIWSGVRGRRPPLRR